jgi:hypothetical protein
MNGLEVPSSARAAHFVCKERTCAHLYCEALRVDEGLKMNCLVVLAM